MDPHADYRIRTTFYLSVMTLVIVVPFAINNFVQGRVALGIGSLLIAGILALIAVQIRRGRFPWLISLVGLIPAVISFLYYSITVQGVIGILWCFPAVISFYMLLPERQAWIANGALLLVAVPTAYTVVDHSIAVRVAATLLAVTCFAMIFVRVISRQAELLQLQAVTDPLTGLFNRSLLEEDLAQAVQQSHRSEVPMTLLCMDLDHFKEINDTHGHAVGDSVLVGVAELIRSRLRRADRVYRIGGEEFLLLLHGADGISGEHVAQSLCEAIAGADLVRGQPVTTSIGIADLRADEAWDEWMRRADASLYAAKGAGRGQVGPRDPAG